MKGTVRIFLCPVYDERGQKYPFNGFRPMAVEIDRFTTNSKFNGRTFVAREIFENKFFFFSVPVAPGVNRIERKSSESSLTIGFDRTFPLQLDNSYKFVSGHSENAVLIEIFFQRQFQIERSSHCDARDLIV